MFLELKTKDSDLYHSRVKLKTLLWERKLKPDEVSLIRNVETV